MATRRQFMGQWGAAGLLLAGDSLRYKAASIAAPSDEKAPGTCGKEQRRINGLIRRDDSILRFDLWGSCATTWAGDDRVFVVVNGGWGTEKYYGTASFYSRLFTTGDRLPKLKFQDVVGYPDAIISVNKSPFARFWGGDILMVDGVLYQCLLTSNGPSVLPDGSIYHGFRYVGCKLIYSRDYGRTWHNQGGGPVRWEKWHDRSKANMAFFHEEPEGAFTSFSFLQMGRNYELNRDGYVYGYSVDSGAAAGDVVMFRVPKLRVCSRREYEFFAGVTSGGHAVWTIDISRRAPVLTFSGGLTNVEANHGGQSASAWGIPSVTFNGPLGLYMMVNCRTRVGQPSALTFLVSRDPWGPFRQVHYESAWVPGRDRASRALAPTIPSKWIAADGTSFWMTWCDDEFRGCHAQDPFGAGMAELRDNYDIQDDAVFSRVGNAWTKEHMPYYRLNMQRCDVI